MKIVEAAHDENGKLRGGKKGDQTGEEVREAEWRPDKRGYYVIRPESTAAGKEAAEIALKAARNKKIGYDQGIRLTLHNALKKADYDFDEIKEPCATDCTGLGREIYNAVYKENIIPSFRTDTAVEVLSKLRDSSLGLKLFKVLQDSKHCNNPNFLKKGDLVVTRTKGHMFIVVEDGGLAYPTDTPIHYDINLTEIMKTKCNLNLRKGAGTHNRIVKTMPKGEFVSCTGGYTVVNGNDWLEVYYENDNKEIFKGFCCRKYLI